MSDRGHRTSGIGYRVSGIGHRTLSLLALALAAPVSAQPPAPAHPATIATLDSVMNAGLTRERFTGGAYVLVVDGRIAASRGFGVTDVSTRKRVHPDSTMFGLSSTTKLFTSIAAARLASEGRVSLDAPIEPYFRESPLGDRTRGVTLAMLLTHTAGYDDPSIGSTARTPADILPLDTYLERSLTAPWMRPRSHTSYSNIGVSLAGHTLSIASGMPFETLLDSTVFVPFGMRSTSVRQPLPANLESSRALPGRASGRRIAPVQRIFFNGVPSAAAYSTPHDMGVLIVRLLVPPTSEDSAVARMLFARRFRNHPALPGMTLGFRESLSGDGVFEHGGDWEDYSNSLYIDRQSRVGLFAVFSSGEGGRTGQELWTALRKTIPSAIRRSADSVTRTAPGAGRCTEIAGSYRDMRMSVHSISKLGVLTGDVREVKVRNSPEGIDVDGKVYRDLGRSVFRSDDGRVAAFRCEEGRPATHLFRGDQPTRTYQRLDQGETRGVMSARVMLASGGTGLS